MRTLIAAVVGTIILFGFQALSWTVLSIHKNAMMYSKDQDAIMAVLSQHLTENGIYNMPAPSPGASMQENQDLMKKMEGKPWASVNYRTAISLNYIPQMLLSLLFSLVGVLLIIMIINRGGASFASFGSKLALVISFSIFLVLGGPLMYWNRWDPTNYIMPDVVDIIVGWFLCGIWLSWYLSRPLKIS